RAGSTAGRPRKAVPAVNTRRHVPSTRLPSTATRWSASASRPSRSAAADTPCSPQKMRSRSLSACASSAASRAGRTSIAARRYLSPDRVARDVLAQLRLRGVGALVHEREPPAGVVEGGGRERQRRAEDLRHLLIRIAVARIGDGVAAQEAPGVGVVVLGVDAEERHPPAELDPQALEERKLRTARGTPRGPLDH